jgi:hypothetical protein
MSLKNMDAADILAAFVAVVLIVCVVCLVVAFPVMLLWNWIVPDITNGALTPLNFWQALGLSFLCHLLFGSSAKCSCKKE